MPDTFGEPDAHDATSRNEKTVTEAAQYIVDLGEQAKTEVQNRELGSVKITPPTAPSRVRHYEGQPRTHGQVLR